MYSPAVVPPLTATTMYCLPFHMYVIADAKARLFDYLEVFYNQRRRAFVSRSDESSSVRTHDD